MAATRITRERLRRLADVKPDRGRVLSVFLNLDPARFATPAARSTAVTSVVTQAAKRVEEAELDHDEREALKQDVERVRTALMAGDIAQNGTRAVAVYACGEPADLLEVVRLRRPVDSAVVLDRSPYLEPLVADATRSAGACCS